MFDIIDPDIFADVVHGHFSVLDKQYVQDQCKELHGALRATFDQCYDTKFIILDRETGKPFNVNALVGSYDAAETFRKILGEDKYMVGHLLIDR